MYLYLFFHKWQQGKQTRLLIYGDQSLLAIELKATLNDNPTNDFYRRQKFSSVNVLQCNTTSRRIRLFFIVQI